jgi:hypothetical protein
MSAKFYRSILFVLFISVVFSFAQTPEPFAFNPTPQSTGLTDSEAPKSTPKKTITYKNTHSVGASAGFVSGLGLSYRRWYEQSGFQLTLLPIANIQKESEYALVSLAVNYLSAIWESDPFTFWGLPSRNLVYGYGGLHYFMERDKEPDFYNHYGFEPMHQSYYINSLEQNLLLGGGVGCQLNISGLQLSLGLGYAANMQDDRHWDDYISPAKSQSLLLHPTIDLELAYTFGAK